MDLDHRYGVRVEWTGNTGSGTSGYRDYGRDNLVSAEGNAPIEGSADTPFRGTPERWNPEELLLASLSQCHMLSYLHVAVKHGIVVEEYVERLSQQGYAEVAQLVLVTLEHPVESLVGGARAVLRHDIADLGLGQWLSRVEQADHEVEQTLGLVRCIGLSAHEVDATGPRRPT